MLGLGLALALGLGLGLASSCREGGCVRADMWGWVGGGGGGVPMTGAPTATARLAALAADWLLTGYSEAEGGVATSLAARNDLGVSCRYSFGARSAVRCRLGAGEGAGARRPPTAPSRFLQSKHLHTSEHWMLAWKHSQYFLRQLLFLQWHPLL